MVFNLLIQGNIARAVAGEKIGTLVRTPDTTGTDTTTAGDTAPGGTA